MANASRRGHRAVVAVSFAILAVLHAGCDVESQIADAEAKTQQETAASPPMEARPAEVGVGIQGQSLRDEQGVGKVIAQPAIVLFQTKEKVAFEIQIPSALKLFQASEGRLPETHDEFMEKIVKFNHIQLPRLPEGQVYRYRPEEGQLWVEPANPTPSP